MLLTQETHDGEGESQLKLSSMRAAQLQSAQMQPSMVAPAHFSSAGGTAARNHQLVEEPFVMSPDYDDDEDSGYYYMGPRASQAQDVQPQDVLSPSASPPRSDASWSPRKHSRDDHGERETVTEQGATGKRVRFTDEAQPDGAVVARAAEDTRSPWKRIDGGAVNPSRRWGATLTRVSGDAAILIGGESDGVGGQSSGLLADVHTLTKGEWAVGLATEKTSASNCQLAKPRAWVRAETIFLTLLL